MLGHFGLVVIRVLPLPRLPYKRTVSPSSKYFTSISMLRTRRRSARSRRYSTIKMRCESWEHTLAWCKPAMSFLGKTINSYSPPSTSMGDNPSRRCLSKMSSCGSSTTTLHARSVGQRKSVGSTRWPEGCVYGQFYN